MVKMLDLWLIRHGETTWNAEKRVQGHMDSPLSDLGMRQAKALALRLSTKKFDAVYSSDSGRAIQTSTIAFPRQNLCLDARLREMHYGILEGRTRAEFSLEEEKHYAEYKRDPYHWRTPGGENWQDLFARVDAWIKSLPDDGRVVAVTHGGVVRAGLCLMVGYPKSYEWNVVVDNTSITRFYIPPEQKVLITFNDTAHIERLVEDYDD
jgi:2,3-bisphosphoglycerate-dependent phosphoglycerate mutase